MSDFCLGFVCGATRPRSFLLDPYGKSCATRESGSSNPAHDRNEQVMQRLNQAVDAVVENWSSRYRLDFDSSKSAAFYVKSDGFTTETGRERMLRLCNRSAAEALKKEREID